MANRIDTLMIDAIDQGIFPGGALLFSREEKILHKNVYGWATRIPKPLPLTMETLFDVSSLTKILATTAIAMRLHERSALDLEMPIGERLPEFGKSPYRAVLLRHLLEHTSGLPAYRPYFEHCSPGPAAAASDVIGKYLQWIAAETPEASPGTQRIYSDLGFIVLGVLLEWITEIPLRELYLREVCRPLKLTHSSFGPISTCRNESSIGRVAATEEDPWRGRLLQGEVHDENASILGGAAGHSGVFTTLGDCHIFGREIVRAACGESHWLKRKTLECFLGRDLEFCLGWDRPSRPESQAGRYFSEKAVGHLGFTGCSLWIELDRGIVAILLTNRIHPHRTDERIKEFRPQIHDALFEYYIHS